MSFIAYKMQGHGILNVFRCVNSISGLYLHPWYTSLMLHVFDWVIWCFKLRERTYTLCDGYGNYDCAVVAQEIICMV